MEPNGLYILLFSIHGLIRSESPELGVDADTGGQVKYVLELAKTLGEQKEVARVDLFTRLIESKSVAPDYSNVIEEISEKVRIVRIRCGGRKYIRKELLWPHLEEFIDNTIRYIKSQDRSPDVFHGHYTDAGYVAMELAAAFDTPLVFTGHSMGRNKKTKLLADGLSEKRINSHYKMSTRIGREEKIIRKADLIVTSTQQEIDKQYGLYTNGKHRNFAVIPPGIDLEVFYPYYDLQIDSELLSDEVKQTRVTLLNELNRFWAKPEKPFILALCRPDHRKNITGLIKAYGSDKSLQAIANLAIFAGIRNDISKMEENEKDVLTNMLLQMDTYDLYGKLAIPKKHDFATEVPELYRLCAETRGVFVNPALIEPFGITLIEASAVGLPIVATQEGGPRDIVENCDNGILVDVGDSEKVALAIHSLLVDQEAWNMYSNNGINGVRRHYSWNAHCKKYLAQLRQLFPDTVEEQEKEKIVVPYGSERPSFGKRLTNVNRLMITTIDNTLVGNDAHMRELFQLLESHQEELAWGIATGRSLELALEAMTEYDIPIPDILLCSVGTEIYYGPDFRMDKGWQNQISYQWKPEAIKDALDSFDFLVFQEAEGQSNYKISYYLEEKDGRLDQIRQKLAEYRLRCNVIYTHGQFLDILPLRASKGRAIDYISYKYEFSPRYIMVAGDSSDDEDMITGKTRGLIVANQSEKMNKLKGKTNIYFSSEQYAAGIIDGLYQYGFLQK
ncbi:HAD-IIB family hydrolase [Desulfopila inferna]|uniref:HAD-IIB family hydrolase n=1 Tax=Desulfopila inferna TaxID=468528 RepID=UPI001963AA04|nr:HAD-IIB family hydrolase [Desulfopila inferna]MBM9605642.1 HAD-IIB family hydrolase [Desulfopila inferna]